MTKIYTTEQKHNLTKQVVIDLLQACGPSEMPEIVAEVKMQAHIGHLPMVLSNLIQRQLIKFDAEFQAYEIRQ